MQERCDTQVAHFAHIKGKPVTNRVTLAQLDSMAEADVATLPHDMLSMLLEDVAEQMAYAKRLDGKLTTALHLKFAERAQELRRAVGKDTGRVRIEDHPEYIVVSDLPSITDWDQDALKQAIEVIQSWGEAETDYVSVTRKVPESKYRSWPPSIRKVFEPARTVRTGKPSYEIVKREAA